MHLGAEILRFVKKGKNNCCVVFSGETASGKSELFKQLLNFLSADFANQNFELKLNSAQIIIEAFANAKTSRNLNASRHGKYFELNYKLNNELSKIVISSAKIELFFLEKYRVVEAFVEQSRESNFHIFYCLLAGLSPQQKLDFELTNGRISSYRLLAQYRRNSRENFINGETTSWMFGGERTRPTFELLSKVVGAFKILNFNEKEIENIWRLLAAILHLGNLRYNVKNYDGKENLELNDRLNIQRICKLLKIEKNLLISSLTIKSLCDLKSEKELNFRKLSIDEAVDRRDTLCVEIYSNIVNFIINKINLELNEENKIINWRNGQQQKFISVGLADFQSLENKLKNGNNFEQLCINYGAECLQQFFIRRIFTLEQAEYAAQCLPEWEERCAALPYLDNLQVLEMLAVQPLSVMSVIDDISIAPEASDTNLLSKLHSSHSNNESLYQKPKSSLLNQFAIRHYTGLVQYKVEGMLLKNKDYFPSELQKLINESELKFLQKIFQNKEENEEGDEISNELSEEELNENGNIEFIIKRIKQNTQCTIVRRSMNDLMRRLESCPEAFFVRCLKANDAQKEKLFETETVLRQMRQFDMLSTVAMCRASFPIHMEYAYFVRRYRPLMPGIPPPNYCDCAHTTGFICRTIFGDSCTEFVQFGKNKAFLKSEQHQFLEMLRSRRLHCCAALVQKCLLGWAKRQQYARLRWATLIFQKHWRGLVERKKFKIIIRGVTRLQAIIRSHQLVIRYQWLKSLIAHFQAIN
uniref:Myosin motor domain-containing protein n=1 Tax=Meloidogyne enterolobii TaxID=390850 RepID=A0A6V7U859_MELEN|nr:unnamed protein product [Meloidogyne enterolobii]